MKISADARKGIDGVRAALSKLSPDDLHALASLLFEGLRDRIVENENNQLRALAFLKVPLDDRSDRVDQLAGLKRWHATYIRLQPIARQIKGLAMMIVAETDAPAMVQAAQEATVQAQKEAQARASNQAQKEAK